GTMVDHVPLVAQHRGRFAGLLIEMAALGDNIRAQAAVDHFYGFELRLVDQVCKAADPAKVSGGGRTASCCALTKGYGGPEWRLTPVALGKRVWLLGCNQPGRCQHQALQNSSTIVRFHRCTRSYREPLRIVNNFLIKTGQLSWFTIGLTRSHKKRRQSRT